MQFWGVWGDNGGYATFRQGTPSGRRGALCKVPVLTTTIGQRESILQWFERPIENAVVLANFGKIGGKIGEGIIGF